MDKEYLRKQINDEDYIIRVRPGQDEDGVWTGEIDLSIITLPGNSLDDDAYHNVMHLVKMMCASVSIMEEIEAVRDCIHEYVMSMDKDDVEITLEDEVEKVYDGNVIKIDFSSRTRGSA